MSVTSLQNKMPHRQNNNRKSRKVVHRGPRSHVMRASGSCQLVQTTTGTTYSNSWNSEQFGFVGATYSISTQILTDVNTYNVRCSGVIVKWIPSAGPSAAAGFGEGAIVLTHTNLPPSTINPTTIAEYKGWKPFMVGTPTTLSWRPRTLNDKLWSTGGTQYLFPVGTAGQAGGGFTLVLSTSCAVTTVIGTLLFFFDLEVQSL